MPRFLAREPRGERDCRAFERPPEYLARYRMSKPVSQAAADQGVSDRDLTHRLRLEPVPVATGPREERFAYYRPFPQRHS
jgi:hypothetical protein